MFPHNVVELTQPGPGYALQLLKGTSVPVVISDGSGSANSTVVTAARCGASRASRALCSWICGCDCAVDEFAFCNDGNLEDRCDG